MTESGTPIAYSALRKGVPVVSRSGRQFGTVEHVLEVPEEDLFDGIVVSTAAGLRFVDRDQIDQISTTRVICTLTDEQAATLPAPRFRADPFADASTSCTIASAAGSADHIGHAPTDEQCGGDAEQLVAVSVGSARVDGSCPRGTGPRQGRIAPAAPIADRACFHDHGGWDHILGAVDGRQRDDQRRRTLVQPAAGCRPSVPYHPPRPDQRRAKEALLVGTAVAAHVTTPGPRCAYPASLVLPRDSRPARS